MKVLTSWVPYKHEEELLCKALGGGPNAVNLENIESVPFDRLTFRHWLTDLHFLSIDGANFLVPFSYYPRVVGIALRVLAKEIRGEIDEERLSLIIEELEKYFESDEEVLQCAVSAAVSSISLHWFMSRVSSLVSYFWRTGSYMLAHKNPDLPSALDDPKFARILQNYCSLELWYQFPLNVLVRRVNNWEQKFQEELFSVREKVSNKRGWEKEVWDEETLCQLRAFCSILLYGGKDEEWSWMSLVE